MTEQRPLNPFEQWMVKSNLQYIEAEGVEAVVNRLRVQGYNRVADAVEQAATQTTGEAE